MAHRGGGRIQEFMYDTGSWSRQLDDMGSGNVSVGAQGLASPGCQAAIERLAAWEHELSIWRDEEEIWVGPVTEPIEHEEFLFKAPARDMFQWFERRTIDVDLMFTGIDVGVIFRSVAAAALAPDNGMGIVLNVNTTGVLASREYPAGRQVIAADALRELARTGIDFTAIGRTITGGAEIFTPDLPTLTTDMLISPKLTERGLGYASKVSIVGGGGTLPNTAIIGMAGGVDPTRGLVKRTFSETSILDQGSADAAAASHLALLSSPLLELSGTLARDTPVSLASLVPGARWPVAVRVGARTVEQTMRLRTVTGTFDPLGDAIAVVLGPLGSPE